MPKLKTLYITLNVQTPKLKFCPNFELTDKIRLTSLYSYEMKLRRTQESNHE